MAQETVTAKFFERPQSGERAVLVHASPDGLPDESEREEFAELARSAGAELVAELASARRNPDPRYFIGRGKLDELAELIKENEAELVIFSAALGPSQERNLEKALKCRVLDRAGLILDIFAQRARSFEGKLQVELAQLRHLSTRLVRGWTHLERQKGGIGLRGPGETQLETDRRLVGKRIRQLTERLEHVDTRRSINRANRMRAEIPTVALVGYTNAGKSTLFNALTDAGVYVQDQLFATLDPTVRRLDLPDGEYVVLADTVGFVRDLPHELIAAFRSTLQEAREADLILHLIDASDSNRWQRVRQVNAVLQQLEAGDVPQVRVYNKIDKLDRKPRMTSNRDGEGRAVWISAVTGEGLPLLREAIAQRLRKRTVQRYMRLEPSQGRQRAKLFDLGAVLREEVLEDGSWLLELKLTEKDLQRFLKTENLADEQLVEAPVTGSAPAANE
ncbi:MAG: GTPase HflX [Gammaproteobacteria bacterium]|nr:GTPase HflX [Gammaproteobacteria bacterium]